jgi:hypothetical protein
VLNGLNIALIAAAAVVLAVCIWRAAHGAPLGRGFGFPRGGWRLASLSAGYGFAIWFVAYALGVVFKTVMALFQFLAVEAARVIFCRRAVKSIGVA